MFYYQIMESCAYAVVRNDLLCRRTPFYSNPLVATLQVYIPIQGLCILGSDEDQVWSKRVIPALWLA
jgi:hypothetical protein